MKYKCETCNMEFKRKCNYDNHLKRKHTCSTGVLQEDVVITKKDIKLKEVQEENTKLKKEIKELREIIVLRETSLKFWMNVCYKDDMNMEMDLDLCLREDAYFMANMYTRITYKKLD